MRPDPESLGTDSHREGIVRNLSESAFRLQAERLHDFSNEAGKRLDVSDRGGIGVPRARQAEPLF